MQSDSGKDFTTDFNMNSLRAIPTPMEKRAIWHDSGKKRERGMGLLVQPTGRKSFFWFRKVNGDPTWKTLGEFPHTDLDAARARARKLNTDLDDWKSKKYEGTNPFRQPDALTLGMLYKKYYEAMKTTGCSVKRGPATEKSLKDTQSWYDLYLERWEDRKLDSIRWERVKELHRDITKNNGPIIANRVVSLLRRCINWGIREQMWKGENPAENIKMNAEKSRERFVQPDEMGRLLEAVEKERGGNWDLHDFVLLSLFCGQRKGNLLAMRWEQIIKMQNAAGQEEFFWQIPVTKNGKSHRVPLLAEALLVLQARKRRMKENAWVFPSTGKLRHIKDMKKSWKRLREAVGIPDVHIHDLRRTLGSFMAGANVSLPIIGKALGHHSIAATQVYARLQLDPVRQAMSAAVGGMKQTQKALEAHNEESTR